MPQWPMAFAMGRTMGLHEGTYRFFFLCLFFRKRFLRLCVAIL